MWNHRCCLGETSVIMFCALFLKYTLYFQHICITGTFVYEHLCTIDNICTRSRCTRRGRGGVWHRFEVLRSLASFPNGTIWFEYILLADAPGRYHYDSNVHNLVRCSHRKLTYPNSVWLHSTRGIIITLAMKIFHCI